jgi:hypothetical protein
MHRVQNTKGLHVLIFANKIRTNIIENLTRLTSLTTFFNILRETSSSSKFLFVITINAL